MPTGGWILRCMAGRLQPRIRTHCPSYSVWMLLKRRCASSVAVADSTTGVAETVSIGGVTDSDATTSVTCSDATTGVTESTDADLPEHVRFARHRQVVLLYGYQGHRYFGSALHTGADALLTVESELLRALRESHAVVDFHQFGVPKGFSRMSRTDRRVSAVGQCITLRMRVWDGVVDAINERLPPDVRVFDYKRVIPSFNVRSLCDSRLYSYTLPSFAFAPLGSLASRDFRLTDPIQAEVQRLCDKFIGVHSFHNFTPSGRADDCRLMRRVLEMRVERPHVVDGVEFVTVWVRGRSFVLHQIRRMVGLVIAVARGLLAPTAIDTAFGRHRYIPTTAPGLGLVMEAGCFQSTDHQFWNSQGPLDWSSVRPVIDAFRQRLVMRHIYRTEISEHVMLDYLLDLCHCRTGFPIPGSSLTPMGYFRKIASAAGSHVAGGEIAGAVVDHK